MEQLPEINTNSATNVAKQPASNDAKTKNAGNPARSKKTSKKNPPVRAVYEQSSKHYQPISVDLFAEAFKLPPSENIVIKVDKKSVNSTLKLYSRQSITVESETPLSHYDTAIINNTANSQFKNWKPEFSTQEDIDYFRFVTGYTGKLGKPTNPHHIFAMERQFLERTVTINYACYQDGQFLRSIYDIGAGTRSLQMCFQHIFNNRPVIGAVDIPRIDKAVHFSSVHTSHLMCNCEFGLSQCIHLQARPETDILLSVDSSYYGSVLHGIYDWLYTHSLKTAFLVLHVYNPALNKGDSVVNGVTYGSWQRLKNHRTGELRVRSTIIGNEVPYFHPTQLDDLYNTSYLQRLGFAHTVEKRFDHGTEHYVLVRVNKLTKADLFEAEHAHEWEPVDQNQLVFDDEIAAYADMQELDDIQVENELLIPEQKLSTLTNVLIEFAKSDPIESVTAKADIDLPMVNDVLADKMTSIAMDRQLFTYNATDFVSGRPYYTSEDGKTMRAFKVLNGQIHASRVNNMSLAWTYEELTTKSYQYKYAVSLKQFNTAISRILALKQVTRPAIISILSSFATNGTDADICQHIFPLIQEACLAAIYIETQTQALLGSRGIITLNALKSESYRANPITLWGKIKYRFMQMIRCSCTTDVTYDRQNELTLGNNRPNSDVMNGEARQFNC
jgi:hypothetical protein